MNRRMPSLVIVAMLAAVGLPAITIHVAPDGDDTGPGTAERPFGTLAAAREAVRVLLDRSSADDVIVLLHDGTWYLSEPFLLSEEDSGRDGHWVRWTAAPGASPRIVGGTPVRDWRPVDGEPGLYRAPLAAGRRFFTLVENGERAVLARHPNGRYAAVKSARIVDGRPVIGFDAQDFPAPFRWQEAQVYVWPGAYGSSNYDWWSAVDPVAGADFTARTLTLRDPTWWEIKPPNRFYVQGPRQFLDRPGEFAIEDGWLYYRPRRLPIEAQEIVAPSAARAIDLRGTSRATPVHHVVLEGLEIELSDFAEVFTAAVMNEWEGAIRIENAEDITIAGCRVANAGFHGVAVCGAARRVAVRDCLVESSGDCGVYLGGYWTGAPGFTSPEDAYVNRDHRVEGNVIRDCGTFVGYGSGVYLYQSGANLVARNTISRCRRYGVYLLGIGWGFMDRTNGYWGRVPTWDDHWDFIHCRDNRIAGNDISDVLNDGQDAGAIYTYGLGRGNVIEGNYVHDVTSGIPTGITAGIYLDDTSDHATVRGNLVTRVGGSAQVYPILLKGHAITCEGNLVAANRSTAAIWVMETPVTAYEGGTLPQPERTDALRVLGNVVWERTTGGTGKVALQFYGWRDGTLAECDRNTWFLTGSRTPIAGAGAGSWAEWRALREGRFDAAGGVDDPRIADPERGDFRLFPGSPALARGFVPVDPARAGAGPSFPFLLGPRLRDVRVAGDRATVTWDPVPGASRYVLRWRDEATGRSGTVPAAASGVPSATVSGLAPGARVSFSVLPVDEGRRGRWSPPLAAAIVPALWRDGFDLDPPGRLPSRWVGAGPWFVGDGELAIDGSGTCLAATTLPADIAVGATVRVDAWTGMSLRRAGVLARARDRDTWVGLICSRLDRTLSIVASRSGVESVLATISFDWPAGTVHRLELRCRGGRAVGLVDGAVAVSARGVPRRAGAAGTFATAARLAFDDLTAAKP